MPAIAMIATATVPMTIVAGAICGGASCNAFDTVSQEKSERATCCSETSTHTLRHAQSRPGVSSTKNTSVSTDSASLSPVGGARLGLAPLLVDLLPVL